jgi:hypothetical protein
VWFVLIKWFCGDEIEVEKMGGVCGTNGGEVYTNLGGET